jgi:SNF2 family DNA or RNA helicase
VRRPHAYQWRGVEWNVGHGGSANFCSPGTGKTGIILKSIAVLKRNRILRRALVIAPLRVAHNVWPLEPAEWAGTEWDDVAQLKIRVLHGPKKDWEASQDADVYVVNFDGLKWLFEDGAYTRFRKMGIDTLVWDESTAVKHTRTKRFKLLKPMLSTFARRWILTGSPNPNGYLDLFGQLFVVDLGRALGRYITHYRQQFFTPLDRMGWAWKLKPGADKQIQEAISPYVFQLQAADYLKLPELVENVVRVDLPKEARRVYDELEEELIVELESGDTVLAVSSGVAAMKCAQVANGGLYHDKIPGVLARTWSNLHTAKIEAVEEILAELSGQPAMVVYDFEHDLARLQKALPEWPHIGGGVSSAESKRLIDAWNADELPGLLVQPLTVSHGLNLQKGSAQHIIWHSLIYDFERFEQLIHRLRRQGSRHAKIFNHLIVARGTVDEAKLRALRRKEKTQTGFLAALKEYAKGKGKL